MLSSNDLTGFVKLSEEDRINGGGYGDIFVGHLLKHGKVALKRPNRLQDDAEIMRFLREVDIWCSVKHQYILPCLGRCRIGRDIYMVSSFIENGDLMTCIRQGKPLNRRKMVYETGKALAYLHEKGIVHGDVKGSNILLSSDGTALLCDFGLSKVFDTMNTSTVKKGAGSTRWMAPELFQDDEVRTMGSDVYAFGITIAEILSGRTPFQQIPDNNVVIFHVIMNNRRPQKEPLIDQDGGSYAGLWEAAEMCWSSETPKRPSMSQTIASPTFSRLASERAPTTSWSQTPVDISIQIPLINDITTLISSVSSTPIGSGGFEEVFLGDHSVYGKVALKKLNSMSNEGLIRQFLREANLWHSVSHPYTLPFYGMCKIKSVIYMVSPFIENDNLVACMARGKEFDRTKILYEIAVALAHLHHIGIVHGDVKAQNILLSDDGTPLLCGFGLSKAFDTMVTSTERKGAGSVRWMAPELFGDKSRSMLTDVYSFGMTIAEMLSGHAPFHHITENIHVMMHIYNNEGRPPKEPLFSPEGRSYSVLWETAEKCWTKDPIARPYMAQAAGMLFPSTRSRA